MNTEHKIKISIACVYNEYEIKTKMVHNGTEQWLHLEFFFFFLGGGGVIKWKLLFSGEN